MLRQMGNALSLLVCAGLVSACTDKPPKAEPPTAATPTAVKPATGDEAAPKPELNPEQTASTDGPWALPAPPPKSVYDGKLFVLSHDYPVPPVAAPAEPPWRKAIGNQPISTANAALYAAAAKAYVAPDMKTLIFDYDQWDAGKAGWYNLPWLAPVREPIHGAYVGSSFPPAMFPQSGLKVDFTTMVLVYYDEVAASVPQVMWGKSGTNPVPGMQAGGAQYAEGSVVVKPAFTTASGADWPPMEGAFPWKMYFDVTHQGSPKLFDGYLFQFDIIIKDTASSPNSQWVFLTLVYDKDAPGADVWDKMVPLGVMWGNDPTVNSPTDCDPLVAGSCPALSETWINPAAPLYAKETLGWGGRLSGPNDGAVNLGNAIQNADGTIVPAQERLAMSSCMSCHGVAEFEQGSFLLPAVNTCNPAGDVCGPLTASCTDGACKADPNGSLLVWNPPGGDAWLQWFQDRPGNVAQNPPAIALDYGMNLAFKSLPSWFTSTGQGDRNKFAVALQDYRGMKRPVGGAPR